MTQTYAVPIDMAHVSGRHSELWDDLCASADERLAWSEPDDRLADLLDEIAATAEEGV